MRERELAGAVRRMAFGYLMLYLDIRVGTWNLLPAWGAYLVMLSAFPVLLEENREMDLLHPFAMLLAAWSFLAWTMEALGMRMEGEEQMLTLLMRVVGLYFHFQMLTNLSEVASAHSCAGVKRLLRARTVCTVVATAGTLLYGWKRQEGAVFLLAVLQVAAALTICISLFALVGELADQVQSGEA